MQNRITQHLSHCAKLEELSKRPQLTLKKMGRPFTVDMQNFFELSFSFAEALLDLEAKYAAEPHVETLDRVMAASYNRPRELDELDVDARWM